MKALVYHGPGRRAWEDVPDPELVEAIVAQVRGLIHDERDEAAWDEVRKNAERHLKQAAKLPLWKV